MNKIELEGKGCSPLKNRREEIEGRIIVYDGEVFDAPLMKDCIGTIVALGLMFTKWCQGIKEERMKKEGGRKKRRK